MRTVDEKIVDFCNLVKRGFGNIADSSVKKEFERVSESRISSSDLAKLLALLEKHNLLDKKNSVNCESKFYQFMYSKMNEKKNA